jgi:hypothetical protein
MPREILLNARYGGFRLSETVKALYRTATMDVIQPEYWEIDLDVRRDDPILLKIVKEVGLDESSGALAKLKIIQIPDDVAEDGWLIQDYDGEEWVAEKHRTWR